MRALLTIIATVFALCGYAQDAITIESRPDSYNYRRGVEAVQNGNKEEALELVVCNKANRELRQIKTVLSENMDVVSSSFEFWYLNNDDLRNSLKFALYMISHVRSWFVRELRNIKTESQPIPEADEFVIDGKEE